MTHVHADGGGAAVGLPASGQGSYTVEIIDDVAAGWDALAVRFADVCLEQTASYMLGRWTSSRLCGLVLRDAHTGEPEALALVVIAALPLLKAGFAYLKFGPLWRPADRPIRPDVLSAALHAAQEEFCGTRGLVLRILPRAEPQQDDAWNGRLAEAGFRLREVPSHPERYLVDLTLGESEQLKSLGAKWRANLRKASPALIVEEVDPKTTLDDFLALYGAMTARKRFTDHHRVEHLPAFVAAAPEALKVRLFLAYADGRPVAGSLIAGPGETVFVPFSASDAQALPLRAGYALRWALINALRGSGAKWLDLGGHEGDDGLRHFKAGNVGTRGAVASIPGEFDYVTSPLSAAATRGIDWTRRTSARVFETFARS